jgi:hypothetical protein
MFELDCCKELITESTTWTCTLLTLLHCVTTIAGYTCLVRKCDLVRLHCTAL